MMSDFGDEPPINAEVTKDEKADIQKTIITIQWNFMKNHQEITTLINSDLVGYD